MCDVKIPKLVMAMFASVWQGDEKTKNFTKTQIVQNPCIGSICSCFIKQTMDGFWTSNTGTQSE